MRWGVVALAAWLVTIGGACGRPLRPPIRYPASMRISNVKLRVDLGYSTFTMRNGLVVVLAPDHESNLVTVDMRYHVGAADEQPGKTGLAHLAEHLTFETAPPGAPTLTERLGAAALSYNAGTGLELTHYYSIGLTPSLESLLEVEARRLAGSCEDVSEARFERERLVVKQEQAQRAEQSDLAVSLNRLVWGEAHPFGHGVGGDDVATLSRDDYCEFIKRYYVPGNATLVIGGNLDMDLIFKTVARHFDKIAAAEVPAAARPPGLPPAERTYSGQLAVDHPMTMVAFPLEAKGSEDRVVQDLAVRLIVGELNDRVEEDDGVLAVAAVPLGGGGRSAVGFALISKRPEHERLGKLIAAAIEEASKEVPDLRLQRLKAYAVTVVAEEHDDMLGRGALICDHSQFARDAEYARPIAVLNELTTKELSLESRVTFSPTHARTYHIDKRPGSRAVTSLATVGQHVHFELPSKLLAVAATTMMPRDLSPAFRPAELTLRNGLRVVLVPRRADAFFEARMIFPAGDADDPRGRAGTAELAATLLRGPSDNLRLGDLFALHMAAAAGSSVMAATTLHETIFTVSGVPSMASLHLWKLHSMLESGDYPADALEELRRARARQERAEAEQAQDADAVAARRAQRLSKALWKRLLGAGHPFLRNDDDALAKLTLEELAAFRDRYYHMDGATLIVVGGFDVSAISQDINELWGAWPKRKAPPTQPLPEARPETGAAYFALDRPDSQQQLLLAFTAQSKADAALGVRMVAEQLLNERLRVVRERLAATYGLTLRYQEVAGASFVVVNGRVAPDRSVEALQAMREAWNLEAGDAGQLALEVAVARRRALQWTLAQSSSSSAIANELAALEIGEHLADLQHKKISAIAAVTTDQVRALVKGDLDPGRMVMAVSGPDAKKLLLGIGARDVQTVE